MKSVIECHGLTKQYKQTAAVDGIDLQLKGDKIYGLLGRNGAGKTTLLNLLTTQIFPTKGEIRLWGEKPYENAQILEKVCYVKERNRYVKGLRILEILQLGGLFYPQWDKSYADRLIKDFDLDVRKKVKQLSRGMESILGIIIGLASRASITIFDEPSLGLDAAARQLFYDCLIEDYGENPRTIILSTHLIDEVSKIFEEVLIMDRGRITLQEEAESLRTKAYYFTGKREKVEAFLQNKQILHADEYGNAVAAAAFGPLGEAERKRASAMNIEVSSIPIQKLFIYLTEKKTGKEAENNG